MQEIWKDIKNYEGFYQVSNLGRVRVLDRIVNSAIKNNPKVKRKGKILKPALKREYYQVMLMLNGQRKYVSVHRLVAQAFIPNPNNLPQVNHKDENKLNNCADNLEWCSSKYNCNYGTRNSKIYNSTSFKKVKINAFDLNNNLVQTFSSLTEASRYCGCDVSKMCKCCKSEKEYKNYIWRYAEK